jgi:hypothetical protein
MEVTVTQGTGAYVRHGREARWQPPTSTVRVDEAPRVVITGTTSELVLSTGLVDVSADAKVSSSAGVPAFLVHLCSSVVKHPRNIITAKRNADRWLSAARESTARIAPEDARIPHALSMHTTHPPGRYSGSQVVTTNAPLSISMQNRYNARWGPNN